MKYPKFVIEEELREMQNEADKSPLAAMTCYVAIQRVRHEGFSILGIYSTKEKAWERCQADNNGKRPSDMSWEVDSYLIT